MTTTIHYMNWEEKLQEGLWLVDFRADWCTACTQHDLIFAELADQFGKTLHLGKVDVSDNRYLADRFGVRNIPHLILFHNGKAVAQMPGIQSQSHLFHQVREHIT